MDLIDDQGRLFGLVNVVDVLVVLLIVAVVVAGIAFVDPFEAREQATRYATIDLGTQPDYLAERVTAGDRMELENSPDNLTITDVYRGPSDDGITLAVRARVNGELAGPESGPAQFQFGAEPFLVGQSLTIETVDYTVDGNVTRVDTEDDALPTETVSVVAVANVTATESERLAEGDAYRVDGQSVAVLHSIQRYPAGNATEQLAILGLQLSTIDRGSVTAFGPHPVRLGATVPFETSDYRIEPAIIQLGTAEFETEETPVVLESTVPTAIVDDVQAGDTLSVGDESIATIESVAVYPTADRSQKRVVLGATVVTRHEGDRAFFGGEPLRIGSAVPFSTAEYDLATEVVRVGSAEPPGEPTTVAATVRLENVRPELAANIRVGQTETVRGETIARVVAKDEAPAVVILESDDGNIFQREHPRNLDLTLTVELQTRQTSTGLRFHGEPVQLGDTIVLDLGPVTIESELTGFEG